MAGKLKRMFLITLSALVAVGVATTQSVVEIFLFLVGIGLCIEAFSQPPWFSCFYVFVGMLSLYLCGKVSGADLSGTWWQRFVLPHLE
ncbi:MAG: hypothetical protein PHD72_01490 [Patescibacteria group bacterium]|nr:hypothetical protein [Patescibacteria group bacterium]